MSRFDEVKRLKELETIADQEEREDKMSVPGSVELCLGIRNAAPWLLEVAEAFQPGDSEILYALLADWVYDEKHPAVDVLRRLQAACEEMER